MKIPDRRYRHLLYSLFSAALLFWSLPAWAAASPAESGIALFKAGKYQDALDFLTQAFEQTPDDLEINFYLGRAAFESGNYELAIMAFERILIYKPDEQRIKLEMARAFYRLGANDIARKYCMEVLDTSPPETVQKNIRAFLVHIDTSEQKWFLNGSFSTSAEWNNNIWVSPSSRTVRTVIGDMTLSGATAQKTQDWVVSSMISSDISYRFDQPNDLWKTKADLYHAVYQDASALDTRYVSISSGPQTSWDDKRLSIEMIMAQLELGRTLYLETRGLSLTLDWALRPDIISSTTIRHEDKDYPGQPAKDGTNLSVQTGISRFYKNTWYAAGIYFAKETTNTDANSFTRFGAKGSVSRKLWFDITGALSYEYQNTKYRTAPVILLRARKDEKHIFGLNLVKKIMQFEDPERHLDLSLYLQHIRASSNTELYEYTLDTASSHLTFYF